MEVLVFIAVLITGLLFIWWADRKKERDLEKKRLPRAQRPPRNWKDSITNNNLN